MSSFDQDLPEGYSIPILYEDREILIVNKPWDIRIDGDSEVTVEKLVRQKNLSQGSVPLLGLGREMDAFRLCNQLDYATSGVLVLGLTSKGAGNCNKLFCARKTEKIYLAVGQKSGLDVSQGAGVDVGQGAAGLDWEPQIVKEKISEVPNSFCMQIDPLNGKECETEITPIKPVEMKDGRKGILFRVRILTGRRHQIRLHLKHIGYPIMGDATYNDHENNQIEREESRMMLHAWKLLLPYPKGSVAVEADPSEFFSHTIMA